MEPIAEEEYAAFLEKVKRTVYFDNLSPKVTASVIRTALDQFGRVKDVSFIPNYIGPKNMPSCALVEMKDAREAELVISEVSGHLFMMCGMPRPVRARPAEVKMFDERPKEPARGRISFQWLDPKDTRFETAQKMKHLVRKHADESSFLLEQQLDQEEKLAKKQDQSLKANYKILEVIEDIIKDKTTGKLAHLYGKGASKPRF